MYQVPRRFNLPAVFVMTTILAIVCGILKAHDSRPEFYLFLAVMTAVTCVAQIYLPKAPRLASTIGGTIVMIGFLVALSYLGGGRRRAWVRPGDLICFLPFGALGGAFLGYAVGTIAASVFLITDQVFRRRPPT